MALQVALTIIQRAIERDAAGSVDEALSLYASGLEQLRLAYEQTFDAALRNQILEKASEYKARWEQLSAAKRQAQAYAHASVSTAQSAKASEDEIFRQLESIRNKTQTGSTRAQPLIAHSAIAQSSTKAANDERMAAALDRSRAAVELDISGNTSEACAAYDRAAAALQQLLSDASFTGADREMAAAKLSEYIDRVGVLRASLVSQQSNDPRASSCRVIMRALQSSLRRRKLAEWLHKSAQRRLVAFEIASSEARYLRQLDVMLKFKNSLRLTKDLTDEQCESMFPNLQTIVELHKMAYSEMERLTEKWDSACANQRFSVLFMRLVPFFKLYRPLLAASSKTAQELERLYDRKSKIRTVIDEIEIDRLGRGKLLLEGLLIAPVQRLPRYPLLLESLKKNTPKEHGDFDALNTAIEMLHSSFHTLEGVLTTTNNRDEKLAHSFRMTQLSRPKLCDACEKLIWFVCVLRLVLTG
jgi:hypothetical protein